MKTTYLTSFILSLCVSFSYGQPKQTTVKAPVSTSVKTIPAIVLKPFDGGLGLWGYKDAKTGKVVIEPAYYEAFPFSFGLALVKNEDSRNGYINMKAEVIIPMMYDGAFPFTEGMAAVNKGKGFDDNNSFESGSWGFIDLNGNEVILFKFTAVKPFSQGLAAVAVDEIWGFIDKAGNEIIPKKYLDAYSFCEGLAMVRNDNGKWGYINKAGATVIPFRYDFGQSFKNGIAEVEINGKSFNINKKGEIIKK